MPSVQQTRASLELELELVRAESGGNIQGSSLAVPALFVPSFGLPSQSSQAC